MTLNLAAPFTLSTKPYLSGWMFRVAYPGRMGEDSMVVIFRCNPQFKGLWRCRPNHINHRLEWHLVVKADEISFSQEHRAAHDHFRKYYIQSLEKDVTKESLFDL